ncbi:MAG: zinc ribbon domain-containing protein [Kiritimatiellia bacterium]|nr:zinc ribbon domain-containing protein [Kiritimatiellia bacterium]
MHRKFSKKFREVERHLEEREYDSCVADCGRLFEVAMRDLLKELKQTVRKGADEEALLKAQQAIATKSDNTFVDFGLGELIALYHNANVLTLLKSLKASNLAHTRRIDWGEVSHLRNIAVHGPRREDSPITDHHAWQMASWLKAFLLETELLDGVDHGQTHGGHKPTKRDTSCPGCETALEDAWRFCPSCGSNVHYTCPNCSRDLHAEWKICPYCETRTHRDTEGTASMEANEYYYMCRGVYIDQVVSARERMMLDKLRLELGLSSEEAETLEKRCAPLEVISYQVAVEAAFLDGEIDKHEREFLDMKASELKIDPEVAAEIEQQCLKLQTLRKTASAASDE